MFLHWNEIYQNITKNCYLLKYYFVATCNFTVCYSTLRILTITNHGGYHPQCLLKTKMLAA